MDMHQPPFSIHSFLKDLRFPSLGMVRRTIYSCSIKYPGKFRPRRAIVHMDFQFIFPQIAFGKPSPKDSGHQTVPNLLICRIIAGRPYKGFLHVAKVEYVF